MSHVSRLSCYAATLLAAALLSGCGLADTAVSATAGATSEAQEAKQAGQIEQHVRDQIQAAQQQSAAQLDRAEKDAQ